MDRLHQSCISKLQYIQNVADRLTRTKTFDHITPELKSFHWLPVEMRIDFKVLLPVDCALHDKAPEYRKNMLQEGTNV